MGKKILEIGSGTGIITLQLILLGAKQVVAVDINEFASRATICNVILNCGNLENLDVIVSNKMDAVDTRPIFDLVISNPPYLPSESFFPKDVYEFNLSGGKFGYEFALEILEKSKKVLKDGGTVLIVASSLGGADYLMGKGEKLGFRVSVVSSKRFFFEEIRLLRFSLET